jgi:PhnB protein
MSPTATLTDTRSTETAAERQPAPAIQQLNPYVCLNGTAEKAIRLYESALGAKVESLQRYGEAGGGCGPVAREHQGLVVHAAVRIGPGVVMFSDMTPDRPAPTQSNLAIALHYTDAAAMARDFDALAAGGTVDCPIQDMFWGAKFGSLKDAYGVSWMFNCPVAKD